jgi:hypothetical protein
LFVPPVTGIRIFVNIAGFLGASITWPANPGRLIADLDLVLLSNFVTTTAESVAVTKFALLTTPVPR